MGQTANPSNENYVHSITPRQASTSTSSLSNSQKIESINYIDGLGRPKQAVGIRAGANNQDIITHIDYDMFGRQIKDYLPYSSSGGIGSFRSNAEYETRSFYYNGIYASDFQNMTLATINPFSEKALDNSPLSRVTMQAEPGKDWELGGGNEIIMVYDYNATNEVRRYYANVPTPPKGQPNNNDPILELDTGSAGYYPANELIKVITKDENWTSGRAHTTEEFKDKQGRVVLKRTFGGSDVNGDGNISSNETEVSHDTFYVYDDFGNLTFVIPPLADGQGSVTADELENICYQYKYDHRNRLIEKTIPGKES